MRLLTALALVALASTAFAGRCDYYFREVAARTSSRRSDTCHNDFVAFLDCMKGVVDDEVDAIVDESNEMAAARTCFSTAGCGSVSFDETDALDRFLPCPEPKGSAGRKNTCKWRYAADLILDLLNNVPPQVGGCMIKYFKGVGERKIEQCTRDYPPASGRFTPPFRMPPLPGFETFDMEEIKRVILYHVMSRYHLIACKSCTPDSTKTEDLIGCLTDHVGETSDVCYERERCENDHIFTASDACATRYSDVRESVCDCAVGEIRKGLEAIENWDELKKMFVRGDWQCEFEKCYDTHQESSKWPAMADRIRKVKTAVIQAYFQYAQGGVPPTLKEAMFVFRQIFEELKAKYAVVLCGQCGEAIAEKTRRTDAYENMLAERGCVRSTPAVIPRPSRPVRPSNPAPRPSGSDRLTDDFDAFFSG